MTYNINSKDGFYSDLYTSDNTLTITAPKAIKIGNDTIDTQHTTHIVGGGGVTIETDVNNSNNINLLSKTYIVDLEVTNNIKVNKKITTTDLTVTNTIDGKIDWTNVLNRPNRALSATDGGNATKANTIYLPRETIDYNIIPGANTLNIKEINGTSTNNAPTAIWYHVYTGQGSDANYQTQLALGMTGQAVYYRNRTSASWQNWRRLLFADETIANATNANYANSAGSATDSSKLNGYASSSASSANTIVRRDANGYIYGAYFNQSSNAETPTTSSYLIFANSDGWFRKSSLANIKSILGLGSAAYTASTAYAAASHTHSYLPLSGGNVGDLNVEGGLTAIGSVDFDSTSGGKYIFSTDSAFNKATINGTLYVDKILLNGDTNGKLGIAYASSASGNYQAGLRIGDITPGNTSYTTLCNDTVCANSLDVKGTLKMSGTSVLSKFLQYVNMSVSNKSSIQTFSSYIKFKLNNATTIMIAWGCTNANNNTNISFPTSFSYIPSVILSGYYGATNSVATFGGVGTAHKQLTSVTTSAFKYRGITQTSSDEETPHYTFWIAVGVSS